MKNVQSKITYKVIKGYGEVREIVTGNSDELEINIIPACDSYLAIGDCIVKVKDGTAKVRFSLLEDGVLTPGISADKRVELEPVVYSRGKLYSLPVNDGALRRLLLRCEALEEAVDALEAKSAEFESKLGTPLKI